MVRHRVGLGVQDLTLALGGREVLRDVSVSVTPGELLALLGPNGAGKSTLLNVLSGELRPTDGSVRLDGHHLDDLSAMALAQRRALMPQKASLNFPFKVRDVVAMGRDPFRLHVDAETNETAIGWALAETDVCHLANRVYTKLSGGEQQRVQLARVLAQIWREDDLESRYLLLDEPTSSLDLAHQHSVLHLARDLADRGVGVVAVVHDLNLAALYANRVAILSSGRLVAAGVSEKVLRPELIADVFDLAVHRLRDEDSGKHLIVPTGISATRRSVPVSPT